MNPDVSLAEKDELKRPLFRDDNKLLTRVMSEEFQDILRTDPTSEAVKYQSNTGNIWMSFYERLHRHTALLLNLTSSAFNLTKNEIKFKSLTSEFFCKQQIENYKYDSKKPHERLSDIFDGKKKQTC